MRLKILKFIVWVSFAGWLLPLPADSAVTIVTKNAVVWSQDQTIRGRIQGAMDRTGILILNGQESPFSIAGGTDTFSVPLRLGEGVNHVQVRIDSAGVPLFSDTLRLTLGYNLRPAVYAYATGSSGSLQLHASILENPDSALLSFSWTQDPRNPSASSIENSLDSLTSVQFASGAASGEYYYTATVATSHGDTVRARACVVIDSGGIRPFDIAANHARWIDSAVVYGVTPYIFVLNGRFADVAAKIPELAQLGVNAIWLQPVYATYRGGQGYDVVDYFRVRSDLGSESDLHALVEAAHANGIRVLFDFIPNHTSIFHPYAQNSISDSTDSHYYSFYQRSFDGAPYSQHYRMYKGFVNYFWDELPNLNYDSPEVRRMILEAATYWIEKFGIDGYRVDVAWGPAARYPEFFKEWRLALKRIKPEALLLAEDKATWPTVFDRRFDAAYDWASEESWVSHWVWQTSYSTTSNPTIFNNSNQNQRTALLRAAMTNSGAGYAAAARIFRFMENNDTFRFLATHDLARTKMVGAMMFSIPGIPLIFNGQEIGASTHPYNASSIFAANRSIHSMDSYGLFSYYRKMALMRKGFPALTGGNFAEMPVSPGTSVYAYRRWEGRQNLLAVINMGSSSVNAAITVPIASMGLDSLRTYYLSDQVGGEVLAVTTGQLVSLPLSLPAYTTKVYVLDTVAVTSVEQDTPGSVPAVLALLQNYPNPFNPSTTIAFDLPRRANVRLTVYDLLGREVERIADRTFDAGRQTVLFDGRNLASGAYFYRLEVEGTARTVKMMLLK